MKKYLAQKSPMLRPCQMVRPVKKPRQQQPKAKRSRGRPKGTKAMAADGVFRAIKMYGDIYAFVLQCMLDDPIQRGCKARAYKAASAKFGGQNGLSRTTIDRRIKTLHEALTSAGPSLRLMLPLLKRYKAAF